VKQRPFLALWTLAVVATVLAFVLHLGLRGRTVDVGYKLGKARKEQARLREVKRVLSLEAASYRTPQRVEMVARTLFAMTPPPSERVVVLKGPPAPPRELPAEAPDSAPPPGSSAAAAASPSSTPPRRSAP
jgi:cell division protein FtsL